MVRLVPILTSEMLDVNFDCTNTISSLTCTTVTKQALTELMLLIPTLPALMLLDHILEALKLFSVATDSLVSISTNIWLLHVTPTLTRQTQAALPPVHVMVPTMMMVSAVLTTKMSAARINAGGRMPLLTYALLTIPKFNSHVLELAFQLKLTVASLTIPMLTALQWRSLLEHANISSCTATTKILDARANVVTSDTDPVLKLLATSAVSVWNASMTVKVHYHLDSISNNRQLHCNQCCYLKRLPRRSHYCSAWNDLLRQQYCNWPSCLATINRRINDSRNWFRNSRQYSWLCLGLYLTECTVHGTTQSYQIMGADALTVLDSWAMNNLQL